MLEPIWSLMAVIAGLVACLAFLGVRYVREREALTALRAKYSSVLMLKRQQAEQPVVPTPASTRIAPTPAPTPLPVVNQVQLVSIGNRTAIGTLTRASLQSWGSAKKVPLGPRGLSGLAGVLEHAPALSLAAAAAEQDLYAVTFSSTTSLRMAVGDALMQEASSGALRAVAIDSGTGRIVEHGTLSQVSAFQIAGFAAAAWTVLTVLVGKKYLADISARLDAISESVQSIRSFLGNEMEGWLIGTVVTLRRHLQELREDAVSPGYAQALLNDCLQLSREGRNRWNALSLSYDDTLEHLNMLADGHRMSEQSVLDSGDAVQRLRNRRAALDVATSIRVGCENLRMSLGFSTQEGAVELEALAAKLKSYDAAQEEALGQFEDKLLVGDRPSLFGKDKFDLGQVEGISAIKALREDDFGAGKYSQAVAESIRKGFLASGPITVLVRQAESGNVTEVRLLSG